MNYDKRPLVWYIAAGYKLPAGIEAYLCHYATEMRKHGFETRIIVFYPLPREKHRFLKLLEERGIEITSLYDESAFLAVLQAILLFVPWFLHTLVVKRKFPVAAAFVSWIRNRIAVNYLKRKIASELPDIIHLKGRLPTNAWAVFPPERTIYHHALMGTIDPSWTEDEVEDFRRFANRIAYIFTPGRNVAETLRREYRIERPVDAIFTMAPDEVEAKAETGNLKPEKRPGINCKLRFGILCRFTEQKGISYILEALREFRDRHGDVDFTFAGQGELETMIRAFVDSNGLRSVRVIPVDNPVNVLKNMDVFVHPGLDDAMPVSIVEALMCGVPCISTNVGGTPDLVRDGEEGFLIQPANAGQILECMERFAGMPAAEFGQFRQRARARYEEVCLPEKVGEIVAGYYRSIVKGSNLPGA